ncbi:MAG: tRNA (cytosine(32)/uridine(32)-2'-O)-methyltransferase TrmJ [Gammaproteobacteria bacterium]|nr:tRNA (cytosine(32)/uridine(32)-2'-O)-methyltransferase TrmJ [Gammaproteobacteria bacterium]
MASEIISFSGYADSIKIVLVGTTHPGNIGAAARAIKTMGLRHLDLVCPKEFPSDEAIYRSKAAKDILEKASIHETLFESVKDCEVVIGTSARNRKVPWPVLNPKNASKEVSSSVKNNSKVAIVFGREDRGLTNEELGLCNLHVHIPTYEDYTSLNLAQAVQIMTYEIRMCFIESESLENDQEWDVDLASSEQTERLIDHMDELMKEVEFYDTENPRKLLMRVRRFFKRSGIDAMEANIFRGLFSTIQKKLNK